MNDSGGQFVVEMTTREGRISERYETFEEARRRIEQFDPDRLVGPAYIFEQLADGSERLLREDGKPLQFHRQPAEEARECSGDALPLSEDCSGLRDPDGKLRIVDMQPPADD